MAVETGSGIFLQSTFYHNQQLIAADSFEVLIDSFISVER
jgi:hypothetical protein